MTDQRRQKLADLRADERRRRRRNALLAYGAFAAVLTALIAMVAVKLATGGPKPSKGTSSADAAVVKALASLPASTFDAVGKGDAPAQLRTISPAAESGPKPRVLYVGAEYCPYCAAQRWAVIAALSRFGTFSGLSQTTSSSTDVFPSTATMSFHGSTYSSPYLDFAGFETETNQPSGNGGYTPLDTLPASDQALLATYDAPPYVPAANKGAIPFLLLGGKYFVMGASYNPGLLQGLTQQQIADRMTAGNDSVGRAIDGTANALSAALCSLTGQQPAAVCTSSGVREAAAAAGLP